MSWETHIKRAIKAATDAGELAVVRDLLDVLDGSRPAPEPVSLEPVEGEATRVALSAAERAKAYRARRASRGVTATVTENVTRVTESVTQNVTASVTDRHEASRLARSLSDSGSEISSQSSHTLSSLREGSDLEERASRVTESVTRASVTELRDGYPVRIPVTESIRARCVTAGAPIPTEADAAACIEDARSKGQRFPDWEARLVRWMIYGRNHKARAGGGSRHVQPAPPGYADELIAAGERRAREGS